MTTLLAVLALATAGAVAVRADKVVKPKPAPPGAWVLIGQTHASHSADHDTIVVKGPGDNFRRIKFKVTDSPLRIHHMMVVYDNGQPDKIDVRQNIPKGGESRAIDLKGIGQRSLRRIDFWYDTRRILVVDGRRGDLDFASRLPEARGMFLERAELASLWQGQQRVFLVTQRARARSVVATLPPDSVHEVGLYGSRILYANRPAPPETADVGKRSALGRPRCLTPGRDGPDAGG